MLVAYSIIISVLLVLMTFLVIGFSQYYFVSLIFLSALRSYSKEAEMFIDEIAMGPPNGFPIPKERSSYVSRWVFIAEEVQRRTPKNRRRETELRRQIFNRAELN